MSLEDKNFKDIQLILDYQQNLKYFRESLKMYKMNLRTIRTERIILSKYLTITQEN